MIYGLLFKAPAGWIAVGMGISVAILSKYGVNQLSAVPQVTFALSTWDGVLEWLHLKEVLPVGYRDGMTYCIVTLLDLHF